MLFINSEMSYMPGHLRMTAVSASAAMTLTDQMRSLPSQFQNHVSVSLGDGSVVLRGKNWLCEPVLWTAWANCGTLRAREDSYMYALQVESFLKIANLYETVRLDISVYARIFVERLKETNPSDLQSRVDAHQIWDEIQSKVNRWCTQASQTSTATPRHTLSNSQTPRQRGGTTNSASIASTFLFAQLRKTDQRPGSGLFSHHRSGTGSTLASCYVQELKGRLSDRSVQELRGRLSDLSKRPSGFGSERSK
mmetsp:Transcript_1110/g.2065  ORF Transcript_1110/g.2065 Transcript_1110/m.2065 type:complete len:251 (-) Transcript_1110:68-820(-)